jgi:phasin family protein
MADSSDNAVRSAEAANAAAAAVAPPVKSEVTKAEVAPVAVEKSAQREAPSVPVTKTAKTKIAKPVKKKPVAKVSRTISKPRRVPAPKAKLVPADAPAPTLTELKEKIMATAKTTDFTKPFAEAASEFQSKAKAAYDKGTELATEATEFAKGNVEAVVESGKVYAAGVQDLSKSYVEEAKSTYETLTADLKEFAAVKSPAELFQLQGKLARRNFDAMVAYGSKNTDAVIKLMNETFAPISGRVSLAAEKVSKAA